MSQSCSKWGHKPEGPCSVLVPSVRKNLETTWCKVQTASPLSTLLALQSDSGVLDCLDPGKGKYLRCIFKDTPVKNKAVLRPAEKEFPNSTVSPNQMLSEITPAWFVCDWKPLPCAIAFSLLEHFSCQKRIEEAQYCWKAYTLVDNIKTHLHDAGSILLPAAVNTCWYNWFHQGDDDRYRLFPSAADACDLAVFIPDFLSQIWT